MSCQYQHFGWLAESAFVLVALINLVMPLSLFLVLVKCLFL